MNEKRAFKRIPTHLLAGFRKSGSHEPFDAATATNISAGGVCLVSQVAVALNEELDLEIQLEEESRVSLRVISIWTNQFAEGQHQIGVKIVDASREDEERFVSFYFRGLLLDSKKKKNEKA